MQEPPERRFSRRSHSMRSPIKEPSLPSHVKQAHQLELETLRVQLESVQSPEAAHRRAQDKLNNAQP
eukprot:9491740-Pyramimonas_sp.AAC.1